MKSTPVALVVATWSVCWVATLSASQRGELREHVRLYGSTTSMMMCCGPTVGVKEIVQYTQLTIEGSVARAESGLHEGERDEYVYTDYVIDVMRTFRAPAYTGNRATPGQTASWPFTRDPGRARPGATGLRVRLRVTYQGTVRVDGGTITNHRNFPTLQVGQHLIVSAYHCRDVGAWVPFGVFEVRDGRVVRLQEDLERDYDSVEAFGTALANPPPTVSR